MTLGDQDRVAAVIQNQSVENWLLNPSFGALLVHGNSRRDDPISFTSAACAILIYVFSQKLSLPTVYWFCGLHHSGLGGSPMVMVQSLICQLLRLPCCKCNIDDQNDFDTGSVRNLCKLFSKLVRRMPIENPVICILDGVSFYEGRHQKEDMRSLVGTLLHLTSSSSPRLILLLTAAVRTSGAFCLPEYRQKLTIAEILDHVGGMKMGLNSSQILSSTESRAKKISDGLAFR